MLVKLINIHLCKWDVAHCKCDLLSLHEVVQHALHLICESAAINNVHVV